MSKQRKIDLGKCDRKKCGRFHWVEASTNAKFHYPTFRAIAKLVFCAIRGCLVSHAPKQVPLPRLPGPNDGEARRCLYQIMMERYTSCETHHDRMTNTYLVALTILMTGETLLFKWPAPQNTDLTIAFTVASILAFVLFPLWIQTEHRSRCDKNFYAWQIRRLEASAGNASYGLFHQGRDYLQNMIPLQDMSGSVRDGLKVTLRLWLTRILCLRGRVAMLVWMLLVVNFFLVVSLWRVWSTCAK